MGEVTVLCKDAKTQRVTRRFDSCDGTDKREGLGIIQDTSGIDGVGPIAINSLDSSRENSVGSVTNSGKTADGKILERLEFIENSYLSYVRSHQKRLESRLIESKEQETVFKEAIQALKQEIQNLASGLEK